LRDFVERETFTAPNPLPNAFISDYPIEDKKGLQEGKE
jgi:hypothetical protein